MPRRITKALIGVCYWHRTSIGADAMMSVVGGESALDKSFVLLGGIRHLSNAERLSKLSSWRLSEAPGPF
jgi:hypothetical protein